MKKRSSVYLLIALMLCSCGQKFDSTKEYTFNNASFESGNLKNWTYTGDAFGNSAIDVASGTNKDYGIVGDFFYNGYLMGNEATGSLKSETFKLKGNGKIGFMIGAGKNAALCYVALCDAKTNQELIKSMNLKFSETVESNRMHRQIIDGSKYLNSEVYIKVVDGDADNTGFNYLVLDDFIVNFQGVETTVSLVNDATTYINNNKGNISDKYRLTYHLMPPVGWMNDPNGFSYYDNKVHLFYQHNPYSTGWDTMYWGHATSDDYISWNDEPVALAPDQKYDSNGCFSGGAIESNGKLYLLYTTVDKDGHQQQGIAKSSDGITFKKLKSNPVISSNLIPNNTSINDFRDPALFYDNGYYYALIGAKSTNQDGGKVLLYRTKNLEYNWEYIGTTYETRITGGGILECPDYEVIDNQGLLLFSPQFVRDNNPQNYQNIHSVAYKIGNINLSNGTFTTSESNDEMEEFDKGFDFYAATCMKNPDGRVIMTAWMNMWSRNIFPSASQGWTGLMVLPRELTIKDNHVYQTPVREIKNYYQNETLFSNILVEGNKQLTNVEGNKINLEFEMDISNLSANGKCGVQLLKNENNHTDLYYDNQTKLICLDRRNNGVEITSTSDGGDNYVRYCKVEPQDGKIKFNIFIDTSSVEVFINDGYYTMTSTVFPEDDAKGINFFASNGSMTIDSLKKYDIVVRK